MLEAVDHIDLKVPDLEEAIAWFAGLGLVEVRRIPERGSVEVALPGEGQVVFELREDATLDRMVVDHIAFRSRSQAEDAERITALTGAGFSRTDTVIPVTGKTISDFTDPWGTRWQLSD
ncbi:VOC family protein [Cnuibacter physcomitrellae]|uniref:VOC family protein n=1 Tax=Cnuibacter physcomitrellae TaxID=1619308 RepID=UPI0021757EFD|nr:VOC family protein [Cnuibacter physcomitrellae]MCS5495904.1 VOC family protein [Cnuibacter physcomitrellae]